MKKQKIAIYCRVSRDGMETENQRRQLVEYAEYKGWDYEVFEEVQSTRSKSLPIKQNVLDRIKSNEFDGILVKKLDRFGRTLATMITEIKAIVDNGKSFYSHAENLDFSTATGQLQIHILSAFAEYEREIIRERTIAGLQRAKAQGKRLGRPLNSKDSTPRSRENYLKRYQKV
jgi:DNA invertase Pin-like site-specific DNA recombinase